MAIIIADRMGSESLAPSFRPRRKQAPSIKHKAVAELQQSLEVLQQAELRAESVAEGSLVGAADVHFESLRRAREAADLATQEGASLRDVTAFLTHLLDVSMSWSSIAFHIPPFPCRWRRLMASTLGTTPSSSDW